jgi:2-alkyl-3-oxoalkanoate reductase
MAPLVALTGGTGFIGGHLASELTRRGYPIRALLRRADQMPDLPLEGRVIGGLDERDALTRLVAGVDAVIHAAGLVAARDDAEFMRVNRDGTANLAAALAPNPRPVRLILLSSLAARSPEVSAYASSKQAGEAEAARIRAAGHEPIIVRPPAIYGPGDRATLPIFAQLARGFLVRPGGVPGRFSLLHVDDLVELVACLLTGPPPQSPILEPDDGRDGGYGWPEIAAVAAERLGRPVRVVALPRGAFTVAAALAETGATLFGGRAPLSRAKVAELFAPDWVSERATLAGVEWRARLRFAEGFESTLGWYRSAGWIKA